MPAPHHCYSGLRMEPLGHTCGAGVYVASKVGGVNCHLLVDTEAQVSIISHTFWLKNKPGGAQLTGYNDSVGG